QREQVHRLRGGPVHAVHGLGHARAEPQQGLLGIESLEAGAAQAQPGANGRALRRRGPSGGGGDQLPPRPAGGGPRHRPHPRRRAPHLTSLAGLLSAWASFLAAGGESVSSRSTVSWASSPRATPPASSALFQLSPKSLRFTLVVALAA